MKKILLAMTAIGALAAAAPAVAQYQAPYPSQYPNQYPNQYSGSAGIDARLGRLQTRLQAGVQQGTITPMEARPLRQQLRDLMRLERQYMINGLTRQERADLQLRIRNLHQRIRLADSGGYDRYDRDSYDDRGGYDDRRGYDDRGGYGGGGMIDRNRDGWDDRDANRDGRWDVDSRYDRDRDGWDDRDDDRDGRWDDDDDDDRYGGSAGGRIDADRDGWDDRDYDRDGRWDDDVSEGRYQSGNRGGVIGQVLDAVIGGGGLRVGQRASANLGAVPYQYRGQFRDGNGSYYRSDGRAIYQIDVRTQTVVRVYPLNR